MSREELLYDGPLPYRLVADIMATDAAFDDRGGVSVFAGQVRADEDERGKVKAIEYSAYEEMAGKECNEVVEIVMRAFPDVKSVRVVHSTGVVKAGEMALLIVVTGGHRDQTTRACRQTLELLKERLPIWKREIYEDDTHRWR